MGRRYIPRRMIIRLPEWLEKTSFAIAVFFLSFCFIPWWPNFFSVYPGMDDAWLMVLHHSFETHKHLGSDIIFYYGPYGILRLWRYYPATFPVVLAGYIFLFLVFAETSWFLLKQFISNYWIRLIFWLSIFILVSPPQEGFYFALCVLAFLAFDFDRMPARNWFILITLAFISQVKFTYCCSSLLALAGISAGYLYRRRIPWVVLIYVAAYLGFWLIAGQKISNLAPHLRGAWEFTSGYSQAMCSPTYPRLNGLETFHILAMTVLTLVILGSEIRKSIFSAILHSLFAGGISFLVFKGAFVRPGEYSIGAPFFMIALILIYGAFISFRNQRILWKLGLIAAFSLACVSAFLAQKEYHFDIQKNILSVIPRKIQGIKTASEYSYSKLHKSTMREMARLYPLIRLKGSADIYSFWQELLLASNPAAYQPRPVFQSSLAYTPWLAKRNAEFLAGPNAPDLIYFFSASLDERYPSLDDGLSWPEIAARYLPKKTNGIFMLMNKLPKPRKYQLKQIASGKITWGDPLLVPPTNSGLVWMKVKFRPTFLNQLLNFLFKPVAPLIEIQTPKETKEFFIIPKLGEAGFLLSPYIRNVTDFSFAFYEGPLPFNYVDRVGQIMFLTQVKQPQSWFFEKDIEVSFFELEFTA